MNLDDELRRLFRDERLDVPVPEGIQQAIFERVRKRRQRRRRPAWFAGGATVVVLVGGGVAFGSGMDLPLLGDEAGDERPAVVSESSRSTTTTPRLDVPVPLDPGRPQFVPDPGELQQRQPQRFSPRPSQGGDPPPLQQLLCAELPLAGPTLDAAPEPNRGELPPGAHDPCAPPERDPLRPLDLRPYLPADPGEPADPTDPTSPSSDPSSDPSDPSDPSAPPSTPSSSTAPPPG